jgi:phosphomevalonate kinase
MRHLRFLPLLILIFSITNCEKKNDIVNSTNDAQIVAFHSEKLYCYWGWDIKIGSETIKADSIPNLKPWADTIFPINGKITIGSKTRICGKGIDYYEIKEFTLIK